jgi:hypothetical protein
MIRAQFKKALLTVSVHLADTLFRFTHKDISQGLQARPPVAFATVAAYRTQIKNARRRF